MAIRVYCRNDWNDGVFHLGAGALAEVCGALMVAENVNRCYVSAVKRHPNFKGKVNTPHGYVLIYVGKNHRLANVNGYAYEHRMRAEEKIGRRLRKGECVHHVNGNSRDNRLKNLEVKRSHFAHKAEHRKRDIGMRNPGERNPVVKCECGCGRKFRKFDAENRRRRFFNGHNRSYRFRKAS